MAPKQSQFSLPYQLDTPKKQRIAGGAQALEAKGIPYTQKFLEDTFEASNKQVRNALSSSTERTKKRSQLKARNHEKLSERDVDRVCQFLDENEEMAKDLTWAELVDQFGFPIHWVTMRNRLHKRGYFIFRSVSFEWIDEELAKYRVRWCEIMLQRYPNKEDWYHIRWSDETHFGWGPEGPKTILRKRGHGTRYKPTFIQRLEANDDTQEEKIAKRVHFWGAIGYNFKSNLIEYKIPLNNNGKMTMEAYKNQILDVEVLNWCKEETRWVLEEDGDSGHGNQSKDNLIIQWKKEHKLQKGSKTKNSWFANCPYSPDLALIEEAWSYPKNWVKKRPHWDDELVRELVYEGWKELPQKWINEMVDGYPQLLQDCIDANGQMVARRR